VTRSTAAGVVYAIAAGNDGRNACNYSPASAPSAITVGATDQTDTRVSWSNYGSCVDIFAPGVNITSAWYSPGTSATNTISGTSMATPHVAGAAALYLQANPSATVAQVTTALTSNATAGVVKSPGSGSPNRLLYSAFITATPGAPVADFTFSCTQLTCNFDGSASSASANATYAWAWGDATPDGSGKTASHTFAASGTYNVTLTVNDGALGTSTKTKAVTVSNAAAPASANFTASCPTLTCTFTNTSTGVAAGATHVWTWGDGTSTTVTTTASQTHTYTTAGNKSVTLTVTNPGAAASSITKTVTPRNCVNGNGDC
jgi:PKD repeat protein